MTAKQLHPYIYSDHPHYLLLLCFLVNLHQFLIDPKQIRSNYKPLLSLCYHFHIDELPLLQYFRQKIKQQTSQEGKTLLHLDHFLFDPKTNHSIYTSLIFHCHLMNLLPERFHPRIKKPNSPAQRRLLFHLNHFLIETKQIHSTYTLLLFLLRNRGGKHLLLKLFHPRIKKLQFFDHHHYNHLQLDLLMRHLLILFGPKTNHPTHTL